MAVKFNLNSYSNIFNRMKENVTAKTKINNWNSDSVIRSIIEPIGAELARVNNETVAILDSMSISSAEGEDLDNIGRTYGVDRLGVSRSSASKEDHNFYFYVKVSNFGSINNGNNILVKAGTLITARGGNENFLTYVLRQDVTLPASSSRIYASVESRSTGEAANLSSNTLTQHNFKGYADFNLGTLHCTNRLPITNGRDMEQDDAYRYRIYNKYSKDYGITEDSIKLSGLEIPGVFVQRFVKNWFGYGRSAVFLFGGNKEINQSTVNRYQSQMDSSLGVYSNVVAMPGVRVYLDLDITVWVSGSLTSAGEINLKNEVYSACSNYIISQVEEREISLISLINEVSEKIPSLSGISNRTNRSKIIEAAYVRKSYGGAFTVSSERVKLVQLSYTLEPNEFFTLGEIDIKIERI